MSETMRKIIFYENILEFKENKKEKLTLSEVNNWEICRTCLAKTGEDDVDVEKLCVMDAMQGTFFNIKDMLRVITNMKVHMEENIATRVCKTCFDKITNLYYFTLQVRKSEQIIKRMAKKIKLDNSLTVIKKEDKETVEDNALQAENTDQSIIIEVEELFGYTPDMENVMEIDASIIEDNDVNSIKNEGEIGNFNEEIDDTMESKEAFESVDDLLQEIYDDIDSEQHNDNHSEIYENSNEKKVTEVEFKLDPVKTSEEYEDNLSHADSFEELYITDCEYLEEALSQSNDKYVPSDNDEKSVKNKTRKVNRSLVAKPKDKQLRIDMPLLEELKCYSCDQIFERQTELVNHVQDEHPNTKAFKCRHCSSAFAHIQSLSRHVRKHKSYMNKYACQFCYREFLRTDDLKRHVRTHTGERPYQCSYCEKAFKQQGEMKSHEATHLPKRTFYCTQCPKTFRSRNGLYLHNRTHHNNYYSGGNISVDENDNQNDKEKVVQFFSDEGE